ncbi:MAG: glycoside hydrolase, partial [Thermoprotei archaeon]
MVNLNDYVSIIHPQIIDGIEAYLVFDKPAYRIGSMVKAVVLLRNHGSSQSIDVKIVESSNNAVLTDKLVIGEGELVTKTYDLPIGDKEGVHELKLVINNKIYDTTKTIIRDPSSRKPLYLTIVWHHHQAPNYTPDGRIHSPWAYIYVWGEQLKPYGKGPYNFHAVILKKHPHFKATYNLSPSLLYQWRLAIERGIEFIDGKKYDPSTPEIMLVKETLNSYIDSLNRGQIDVLTSMYAHTIAGFLTDVMKAHDIVYEEIAYGKKITEETMGGSYEAQGIWT